jgi:peptidoglycan/LPS O-acetylase OafA/YrhL
LDALRGIAALIVVLHHLSAMSGHGGIPLLPFLAVDVFFVLSGFVMARTYEARLREGSLSTVSFVVLRYRRLFLPMALGTTLGLISFIVIGIPISPRIFAAYLLWLAFIPAFWLDNVFLGNVPGWSLFLEIISNAIHAAVLAKLSSAKLLLLLAANLALCCLLWPFGLASWGKDAVSILSCLPRELSFYLAGIVIWRRYGDAPFQFASGRWAVWLGGVSYPLYATHVPVIGLVMLWGLPPFEALIVALTLAVAVSWVTEKRRISSRSTYDTSRDASWLTRQSDNLAQ